MCLATTPMWISLAALAVWPWTMLLPLLTHKPHNRMNVIQMTTYHTTTHLPIQKTKRHSIIHNSDSTIISYNMAQCSSWKVAAGTITHCIPWACHVSYSQLSWMVACGMGNILGPLGSHQWRFTPIYLTKKQSTQHFTCFNSYCTTNAPHYCCAITEMQQSIPVSYSYSTKYMNYLP